MPLQKKEWVDMSVETFPQQPGMGAQIPHADASDVTDHSRSSNVTDHSPNVTDHSRSSNVFNVSNVISHSTNVAPLTYQWMTQ